MIFLKTSQAPTLRRAGGHTIELKVRHSGTKRRDEMALLVKSEDPMWILIDKVCQSWGSTREKARFFADGVRILLYHTAESLELDDGDKIDFFTEQLGGADGKMNIRDETFEQASRRQNNRSPFNCDEQQTGSEGDAQFQSQVSIRPSDRTARMNGRSEVSRDDTNRYITREESGTTQNISAEDNVPEIAQGCQNSLSIQVTNESSGKQLMFKLKFDTPMRKLRMNVCARLGVQLDLSCLMHAGRRISSDDTPASLKLNDGDQIELHVEPIEGTEIHQIDSLDGAPSILAEKSIAACREIPPSPQSLKIKVGNVDSCNVLEVRMSNITPMGKLMSYACKQWQVPQGTARFMVDGHRILEQETASSLEMVNGDEIHMFREQHGGETLQPAPQIMDLKAKQTVILPIRLSPANAENVGGQDEITEVNAPEPQKTGEQGPPMCKGPITALRSPQRSLDIHVSFPGSDDCGKVTFRLGPHTPIWKVMRVTHECFGFSESDRFFYEGVRLDHNHTPFELMMGDGDHIEVFRQQLS